MRHINTHCTITSLTLAIASTGAHTSPLEEVLVAGKSYQYIEKQSAAVTKTNTDILKIPQSVIVLNEQLLRDQDNQNLSDALNNVSGVTSIALSETLTSTYKLRGFDASVYQDGLPAYSSTASSSPTSLVNIERIAVVKGPTATLYGGGTGAGVGGMINVISKSPSFSPSYSLGFRTGSFSTRSPWLDINQPLTDQIAVRVTAAYEEADSHIDHVESTSWSFNPSVLFRFSAASDLLIKVQHNESRYLEYAGLPVIGTIETAAYSIDTHRFSGAINTPDTTIENTLITATFSHTFSANSSANVTVRYYDNAFDEYNAFPYEQLTADIADINSLLLLSPPRDVYTDPSYAVTDGYLPTETRQFNLNANLLTTVEDATVSHRLLLGVEVDQTENEAELFFNTFCEVSLAGLALLADPFNPALQQNWLAVIGTVPYLDLSDPNSDVDFGDKPASACFGRQDNRYETTGVYLQDQLAIGSQWTIDLGLRWTDISIQERGSHTEYSDDQLTSRIGVTWSPDTRLALFASYGEGFEAPLNVITTGATIKTIDSKAWEAGIKWHSPQGINATLAWFDSEKNNVATADPVNPGFSVQVGQQSSRGVELDLLWPFATQWSALANYAYINAEVSRDNRLPIGDQLARVPERSGRISMRYQFEGALQGLSAQLGATWRDEVEITLPNNARVDAWTVLDAQIAYDWGAGYRALFAIQNLTDKDYFLPNAYLGLDRVEPGRERAFYLSVEASFM